MSFEGFPGLDTPSLLDGSPGLVATIPVSKLTQSKEEFRKLLQTVDSDTTPIPEEETDGGEATPVIGGGSGQTVPTNRGIPLVQGGFFQADLSKNRLYKKRMERKRAEGREVE